MTFEVLKQKGNSIILDDEFSHGSTASKSDIAAQPKTSEPHSQLLCQIQQ